MLPRLENASLFGLADFYSKNFAALGYSAGRSTSPWGNRPQPLPRLLATASLLPGKSGAPTVSCAQALAHTLNSYIDLAGREAGNIRLFEATGVGAFLLTDFKDNLHTLFAPDREVAVWRSIDDCVRAVDHHLGDDKGRAEVAHAGQARTMAHHTYRHRATEILGFVDGIRAQR